MVLHDSPIYRKDSNDTEFSAGKAVFVVSMSILNVFMLLGNIMSIVTIATSPSLRRCTSYWFVLNLAVTDMVIAVIVVPLNTAWEYYGIWPFGKSACGFITFADNSFSTVSAYSIVLVSVDKYLYITHAIHYHHHMTRRLAFILILGVWVCVSVFSAVSIFAGISASHFEENIENSCIFVTKDLHAITVAVLSFFIPLVILCFTTIRIICIAKRHIRRIRATPSFSCTEPVTEDTTYKGINSTKQRKSEPLKRKSICVFPQTNNESIITDIVTVPNFKNTSTTMDVADTSHKKNNPTALDLTETKKQSENLQTVRSCPSFTPGVSATIQKPNRKPYCKLFGTVTIVIACFILMFAPYYITLMVDAGCHCVSPWLYEDILAVLCHSHALVNPFIYILTDRKYKTAFQHMWNRFVEYFYSNIVL